MPEPIVATYRVQLRAELGFDAAAAVVPYLAALGVSHLYSSPCLQAAAGSAHGYDVVDPARVNAELGGEAGREHLVAALAAHGLGQVLDLVPNHMSTADRGNRWWWDVLENGQASRYAGYFDIDWDPPQARLRDTVLLPILGDQFGRVLEGGELRLVRQGGAFEIHYHDHRMPVAPRSLDALLAAAAARCGSPDLAFIADAYGGLPAATATDAASVTRRHRDKEVLRGQLARLAGERPAVAAAIETEVAAVNADLDRLDALLARQNYRLAFWRMAGRELDYRRFFDVQTLVGLRAEDERVFADTHALPLAWVARGELDGLRIDHPDGLHDPGQYFDRLRRAAPAAWIVAEKILQPGEDLPAAWPIDGTTGYDFLNLAGGLLVDPLGEAPLSALWTEVTGSGATWHDLAVAKRLAVMDELLAADVNRVVELFLVVCERHRRHRDHTRHDLREAVREVAACMPVYRTYVRSVRGAAACEVGDADRRAVAAATAAAQQRRPDLPADLFDFFRDLLLLDPCGEAEGELAMRFQQLTAPVMAKGVEDTAFYSFHRLVSLCEVGGDPGRFGVSPAEFHRACAATQERWPRTMLATSTHDTKRGEDARARLALLSEIPERWRAAVRRWFALASRHRHLHGHGNGNGHGHPGAAPVPVPDPGTEYLFYQTLVGAWPLTVPRATAYMEKAAREAKTHTSWTRPHPEYEAALRAFVAAVLGDAELCADIAAFVAELAVPGWINGLAQTLLKLTAPGIPDIYQGSELWNFSLVDPDNRQPVDYDARRRLLAELPHPDRIDPAALLARLPEGLPKLWLIRQALALRRRRPAAFGPAGAYRPLAARGARAAHAVAFERGGEVVAVVPRLVLGLAGDWAGTTLPLPAGRWRNELTGESCAGGEQPLAALLAGFPVALLARD